MVFDMSFALEIKHNDENFRQAFSSFTGEEYVVNVNSNYRYGYNNEYYVTVTVSWEKKSRRFLRLRSYSESKKNILSDIKLFVDENQLSASASDIRIHGRSLVIINVFPYDNISNCLNVPSTSNIKQNIEKVEPVVEKRLEHLSSDLGNLLQTGHFSDVTLTDGSKEIHAHKLILSTRSPVFSKMFLHPMKENKENRITIKDISIEVLKSLLDFMYTGTIVLSDMKMARNLYIASDKYDVKNLKSICSEMLKSVNRDSFIDTLLLADLYQDTQLKQAALNFIAGNYSQLKVLAQWNKFMKENQGLAIEVLSFVLEKK